MRRCWRPLPYPKPDQLVMVWSQIKGNRNVSAAGSYLDWKQQATVFQDLNAFSGRNANLANADHPEQVQAGLTTPGFFRMVGNPMFLGRDFVADEGQPGKRQRRHPDASHVVRSLRRRSRHRRTHHQD